MFTLVTQTTIAILTEISKEECSINTEQQSTMYPRVSELLIQLEAGGLIYLLPDHERNSISSYRLVRSIKEISLLDILTVTNDHINCNLPLGEKYYFKYGNTAHKLGVLNSIMRNLLSGIKLDDL